MFGFFNKNPMHQYLEEMHKKYHSFATWPVNQTLNLGDVGILKDNQFTRWTTLKDLDIEFSPLKNAEKGSSVDLLYTSNSGVETCGKFSGNVNPPGWIPPIALNADMSICLKEANSIYFNAVGITTCNIIDKNSLKWKLIERFENNINFENDKQWNLDWVVITDLQYAKKATFILSNGKESYIAIKANGEAIESDIAKLNCGFSVQGSRNVGIQIVANEKITPLFNGIKLRNMPYQGIDIETFSSGVGSNQKEKPPSKIIYDDLIICEDIQFQSLSDISDSTQSMKQ